MAGVTRPAARASLPALLATCARIKLAVQCHSPALLRLAGALAGVVAAAATWAAVVLAGSDHARLGLLMLVSAAWATGAVVGPGLAPGTGGLQPDHFTLLPLPRVRVAVVLLGTAFAGVGPAVLLVALAAIGVHAAALDPALVWLAVIGVVLLLGLVVVASRMFSALVQAAMRSRWGVDICAIRYGLLIAGLPVGWMAVHQAIAATPGLLRTGLADNLLRDNLSALPTSWPLHALEAAATGQWLMAAGWLVALCALAVVLAAATVAVLVPRVGGATRHAARGSAGGRRQPTAHREVSPATTLGAALGKELRLWWRDPPRRLWARTAAWSGLFIGLGAFATGNLWAVPFAPVVVALGTALAACHRHVRDGAAVRQPFAGAGTRRGAVRGRQLAVLVMAAVPAVALAAVSLPAAEQPWAWVVVPALLPVVLGVGSALAVLLPVATTAGVESRHRRRPRNTGNPTLRIAVVATAALVAPAAVTAAAAITEQGWLAPAAVVVGVTSGITGGWWLPRAAHQWIDHLERDATDTSKPHRPTP